MAKLLESKIAVVTGASQGLGMAIATALGIDGARVLVVSRRRDKVETAASRVRDAGGIAESLVADITQPGAAGEVMSAARAAFGGIDILVNCAGIFIWKKLLELTAEDWSQTLATNLSAPFHLTQAAGRLFAEQGRGGAIINIASIHGKVVEASVVPHCASKFGLIGLTKAAAEALREFGVRVNAIAPGAIEPNSAERRGESPLEKVTEADIATLAVYLSSDLARSITGAVIDMFGSTRTLIKI
jgi:3-oxoacyl-[acyl-carrier protein] reductase